MLLDAGLGVISRVAMRRHPGLGARLAPSAGARILIDILDVPCALLLTIARPPSMPSLRLANSGDRRDATATITGKLGQLMDLLDANIDGDTMFFSRDLFISGDTTAILLLRNALDGEDFDLFDDVFDLMGPFSGLARRARRGIATLIFEMDRRNRLRKTGLTSVASDRGAQRNKA